MHTLKHEKNIHVCMCSLTDMQPSLHNSILGDDFCSTISSERD